MKKIILFLLICCSQMVLCQNENYEKELDKGYKGTVIKDIKYFKNAVNFAVIGDWGRHGNFYQKAVAEQLSGAMAGIDGGFIVSTGDNFYPSGVRSEFDPAWKYSFEDVYNTYFLHRNWYAALGNHDYAGNPQAQIDYSKISQRWKMPSRYFVFRKYIEGGTKKFIEFFVIDTTPFQPSYYEKDNYSEDNYETKMDTLAQKNWLENGLKTSTATWKIVVGHHPIYSAGKRKGATKDMERSFKKIFEKYNVDAYFCGHEHHLEYDKVRESGFVQILSGSGSEVTKVTKAPYAVFAQSDFGFVTASVSVDKMLVQFINWEGKILYSDTILKK